MVRPHLAWSQPPLFDEVRRGYRYGRVDLRRGPALDNPWLAWALHLAHVMAEARGFDPTVWRALNRNLVMLLADHSGGELICTSDFHRVLRDRGASIAHTTEVLQEMGILGDDRPTSFEQWLVGKLDGLAQVSARRPNGGRAPCATAARAPAPATRPPSGDICAPSARPCWRGRPATTICGRSPTPLSSPTPRHCAATNATRRSSRCGRCLAGRGPTA
jgi:hypothetical protein